jgi:hypothetical protein
MASAWVLSPLGFSQWEVEFSQGQDPPKGYRTVPIGCGTYEFVQIHMQHDYLMLSFLSISLVWFTQPRRSAPEEGDNVMLAGDPGPGNGHSI